jgi:hypothetical protein
MHTNEHEKALQWAEHVLASKITSYQIVVETPWSVVYKIETPQSVVYLKQVPEALFLEPDILTFLHSQGCKNIPEIIAADPELHCFLTKSCGNMSLRELFKRKVNFPLLATGINSYTTIQRQLENKMQFTSALGIPDWRLDKFTSLYSQLISQDKLLLDDGLAEEEIKQLHQLHPTCQQLCDVLSKHDIPETFSHSDFQENNMLLDEQTGSINIIDWGETVIAHPFFSLNGCLWNLTYFNELKSTDSMYRKIQSECIAPWLNLYDEKTLLELLNIANQLLGIYAALEYERLYVATQNNLTRTIQQEKRGSIAGCLRSFLNCQT